MSLFKERREWWICSFQPALIGGRILVTLTRVGK
jgi:hypothetical protein